LENGAKSIETILQVAMSATPSVYTEVI